MIFAGWFLFPSGVPIHLFILVVQHLLGSSMGMRPFIALSTAAQLAAHLREEILRGELKDNVPGYRRMAELHGVNHKTMRAALALLEEEGLLVSQGSGRCCRIQLKEGHTPKGFRVSILPYDDDDRMVGYHRTAIARLEQAGHVASFAEKTLSDLNFDVKRLARFVRKNPSDAWVVIAGTREVLEWFAEQPAPAFALAGRASGIPIAGATVRKAVGISEALRRLGDLGHRRIVLLVREDRRKPFLATQEEKFLAALEAMGVETGPYNLPDWADTIDDFHRCLDSLFGRTPPTALLIDEAPLFFAVQQFLAQRGLSAPRDISILCLDPNLCFSWSDPPISYIHWKPRPLISRIVRWADNVARGMDDRHKTSIKAEFVEGGTIGPVPTHR